MGWPSIVKLRSPPEPPKGKRLIAPTDFTSGRALRRSNSCWKNAWLCRKPAYLAGGRATRIVSKLAGSNPGLTSCNRRKLWIINPAPMSSTNARANSETTSKLRSRSRRRLSVPLRPPSLRASFKSVLAACKAGAKPNSTPVRIEMPSVNSTTR